MRKNKRVYKTIRKATETTPGRYRFFFKMGFNRISKIVEEKPLYKKRPRAVMKKGNLVFTA